MRYYEFNVHRNRFHREPADDQRQAIRDGAFEDVPEVERPGWYARGRRAAAERGKRSRAEWERTRGRSTMQMAQDARERGEE